MIADTSGLLALFNRSEPAHTAVSELIMSSSEPLVVSPYVLAELDYLVATRLGLQAELDVLAEIGGGAYELASFTRADVARAVTVIERYADHQIGLADASIVVLADSHRTRRVLTLDRRHFDVVRPLTGGRFEVLPH